MVPKGNRYLDSLVIAMSSHFGESRHSTRERTVVLQELKKNWQENLGEILDLAREAKAFSDADRYQTLLETARLMDKQLQQLKVLRANPNLPIPSFQYHMVDRTRRVFQNDVDSGKIRIDVNSITLHGSSVAGCYLYGTSRLASRETGEIITIHLDGVPDGEKAFGQVSLGRAAPTLLERMRLVLTLYRPRWYWAAADLGSVTIPLGGVLRHAETALELDVTYGREVVGQVSLSLRVRRALLADEKETRQRPMAIVDPAELDRVCGDVS